MEATALSVSSPTRRSGQMAAWRTCVRHGTAGQGRNDDDRAPVRRPGRASPPHIYLPERAPLCNIINAHHKVGALPCMGWGIQGLGMSACHCLDPVVPIPIVPPPSPRPQAPLPPPTRPHTNTCRPCTSGHRACPPPSAPPPLYAAPLPPCPPSALRSFLYLPPLSPLGRSNTATHPPGQ